MLNNKTIQEFLKSKNLENFSEEIISELETNIKKLLNDKIKEIKNKKRVIANDNTKEHKVATEVLSKSDIKALPTWVKNKIDTAFIIGKSNKVIQIEDGRKYHMDNNLNDLSGGEWTFFLNSVVNTRYTTNGEEGYAHDIRKIHPSPKPPQLMKQIVEFFTKENDLILDYFMGVGGTLLGASLSNRRAIGIDLSNKYIEAYKTANKKLGLKEQITIECDSMKFLKNNMLEDYIKDEKLSLILIDPPYGDMLSRERTGENLKNKKDSSPTPFTNSELDLGNMKWSEFLPIFKESILNSINYLKNKGHIVIFIKDLQPKGKELNLLHADIIKELNTINDLYYLGTKIWADQSVNLYPYGYPYSYVSNQIHQYIMIFKKMTFNVKEEVAKRHFFLKNILENSIGDEELEINRINYNILLKQIKERYFVKFVNGKKVLFATTFHNDKIFLFLDYNSFYICKNINDINSSIKKIKGNNKMEKKNLWILTEERPKKSVIYKIIEKFVKDYSIACFIDNIRILPILNPDKTFSFTYEVLGMKSEYIDKIYIKIVSGYSSFVDFLIFYQIDEPNKNDIPIYAIEETKTDDSESRNTGIFQRASKFVYIDNYYPNVKKIMLYSLQIKQKDEPTETNIFGTRCLLTLGIEIIGKETDTKIMKPFVSIKELIDSKNSMRMPPKGNIPIKIYVYENNIQVSGRLFKSGGLSHDPNIGSLSLICATLRKLGWDKRIEIIQHGLEQIHVANAKNKFIRIANRFNIVLQRLNIPCSLEDINYWKYDLSGEKLGTIFIHLIIENFTQGFSIYENHAGCERGYFYTSTGEPIVVGKYIDKEKYKSGNKSQIIHIPDLVIADFERLTIVNIEGKKEENVQQGIKELDNFDAFENLYVKKYYSEYKTILRTVVLYGSNKEEIEQIEVSFMLNNKGKMILGIKAPEIFKIAIKNLFDYWRVK